MIDVEHILDVLEFCVLVDRLSKKYCPKWMAAFIDDVMNIPNANTLFLKVSTVELSAQRVVNWNFMFSMSGESSLWPVPLWPIPL